MSNCDLLVGIVDELVIGRICGIGVIVCFVGWMWLFCCVNDGFVFWVVVL